MTDGKILYMTCTAFEDLRRKVEGLEPAKERAADEFMEYIRKKIETLDIDRRKVETFEISKTLYMTDKAFENIKKEVEALEMIKDE